MDDIVKEFLVESAENLDQLDRNFVELEKNPTDKERLASIFRVIHTIKGTCGFLGYSKLEKVAHVGESLLSKMRDGLILLTPSITSTLLKMVDAIRAMLANIESSQNEGSADYSLLVEEVAAHLNAPVAPVAPLPAAKVVQEKAMEQTPPLVEVQAKEEKTKTPAVQSEVGRSILELLQENRLGPRPQLHKEDIKKEVGENKMETKGGSIADTNIRVDVDLLDKLMNLVGELVLTRNQILQFSNPQEDSGFLAVTQRLNLITSELQEGVMKTRMQPIGNIWGKFPRVVRDLAGLCNKKIRLQMEGQETELDKSLLEAIKDPLTHIIRNSVDHGIEDPKERLAKGKDEEGYILLRAYHEGGQVNIEISDNGGGINPDKVKAKALQRGLITPEEALQMSDRQVANFVFLPGFSTAERVSNISGRGVGMDVVRTNIEKIGGLVEIQSSFGKGTTIKIKIPLTLAIIPALIVTSGGEKYAIPQASLLELLRVEKGGTGTKIERLHGIPVYRLRGNLLPLVFLNHELRNDYSEMEEDQVNIVVLQADGRQFGLVVDAINDTQEIVVKPLGKQMKGIHIYAGATILGDGNVILILDVMGIAKMANVVSELKDPSLHELEQQVLGKKEDALALLLFASSDDGRMAVPLSEVTRLEKFATQQIEWAGGQQVIQYRNEIMPLISVSGLLPERRKMLRNASSLQKIEKDFVEVIVYSRGDSRVGILIEKVIDIVETTEKIQCNASRKGILGSIVIQNRVTELLDIKSLIEIHEGLLSKKREVNFEESEDFAIRRGGKEEGLYV
ncbi:MAG: chemotaxis protein CheA [Deltaproteobacteria bacterium]|nr:chemotaxis protein CheA [Deltaproteobacteria bacterium]